MKGSTRADILSKLNSLAVLCKSGNLIFETRTGTFQVIASGEIQVEEMTETIFIIDIKFRQPAVLFATAAGSASGGTGYLISGYNLRSDFGIVVSSISNKLSIPAMIEVKTTAFYSNPIYRGAKDINISCTMLAVNVSDLTNKMGRLHGLLAQPGLKILTYPDGTTTNVYSKNGFSVSGITEYSCQFTLTLRA